MKMRVFFLSIAAMLFSIQLAFAHGGGHGASALNEEKAVEVASQYITMLIEQGVEVEENTLDESWGDLDNLEKAVYEKGDKYYIISFEHEGQEKLLYVLISDQGEFYDANYSGEFEQTED